ncbi:uncharacterized protein LOC125813256 [Solanum verrucosum]|uniref:uncharacterized protein LOC125813256 n=1 Tax=Solanum verrucosum TaxID=315347 RepID=UPI0020D019F3|nr:uncharacterized protein LOC125813256 [Solanum verrucosum]
MPFPMKIQPVDFTTVEESSRYDSFKPVPKSRFKRLFERQFSGLLRSSAPEKLVTGEDLIGNKKDASEEFEPSSVCLAKMVQTFIEEGEDKHRCNRNRCNCFNCNGTESSEEENDSVNCFGESNQNCCTDACEILKSLVSCPCLLERNVLAEITKIIEKNRMVKRKANFIRKMVVDGLLAMEYDASICESRWEKTPSTPAGAYEYIDVVTEGERLIIDIDFRSEFEIARSTRSYKCLLQVLPNIFVGKADRLQKIVHLLTDAAKLSLKKKGMPCPPWRKAEYVKAKWLSTYTRMTPVLMPIASNSASEPGTACKTKQEAIKEETSEDSRGELNLVFGGKSSPLVENNPKSASTSSLFACDDEKNVTVKLGDVFGGKRSPLAENNTKRASTSPLFACDDEKNAMAQLGEPLEIKPKDSSNCARKMTGLTSLIEDHT